MWGVCKTKKRGGSNEKSIPSSSGRTSFCAFPKSSWKPNELISRNIQNVQTSQSTDTFRKIFKIHVNNF